MEQNPSAQLLLHRGECFSLSVFLRERQKKILRSRAPPVVIYTQLSRILILGISGPEKLRDEPCQQWAKKGPEVLLLALPK
jgi:hypothetical protein